VACVLHDFVLGDIEQIGCLMKINSTRFGELEPDDSELIHFEAGLIGFREERDFVLIAHGESPIIAWLQSRDNGALALPVVSAHGLTSHYPDVAIGPIAQAAGLGDRLDDLAVMAILCAVQGQPATVNLLAPVVVNVATRKGAQLILDGSRFSTRELFVLPGGGGRSARADGPLAIAAAE